MNDYGMLIVGAGEAGARAAIELRNQGWNKAITIIGEEKWQPYERPPLSKQQLLMEEEPSPIVVLNSEMLRQHNINLISSLTAIKIDRQDHKVLFSDGTQLGYERLLLATGAYPRKLSIKGSGLSSVLYLRTFADALSIREQLQPGKRIVVIGGGFIGLEVAASSIAKGCNVTVIEMGPRILMRGVPEQIASLVEERHRQAGVDFKLGVSIESINSTGDEYVITLADGTVIHCDRIVAGVGAIPATALAEACGLELDNGICANELLMTSDPDIFTAGDCCSFPHPLYDGRRIRLKAWRNAQDQGLHVAGSMLGATAAYGSVPWFWSDQYELTLQVAGLPDGGQITVHRDLGEAGKLIFHLNEAGRLFSVSGLGLSSAISKEIRLAEMLIERQATPEREALGNPTKRLKDLLRA